jgi:hypothetical protein
LGWEIQLGVEVRDLMQVIDSRGCMKVATARLTAQRFDVVMRMGMGGLGSRLSRTRQQGGRVSYPAHEHGQEEREYQLRSDSVAEHFRSTSLER